MTQESAHQAPTVVRIDNPAGLVAALPALLGFTPRASLVVIGMHRREGRSQVGAMLRTDLPTNAADERALTRALHSRLAQTGPDTVHLVVVADPGSGCGLPHAGLVDTVTDTLSGLGIEVSLAIWTPCIAPGDAWACYDGCCAGTLPDPQATEVAAHLAVAGKITYRSREDAAAALAPDPAARSTRRRAQLDAAHHAARRARARARIQAVRDDLDAVREAAATLGRGERLDEAAIVRVVAALADPAVRDVCLGFVLGGDDTVAPEQAERLWWVLTRAAPAPEVAEPATLLAFAAIEHGGGATLSVALERASGADPDHALSRLLGELLECGIAPSSVRDLTSGAAAEATARLAD